MIPSADIPEDKSRRKRLKVTSACTECRRRKTKCNAEYQQKEQSSLSSIPTPTNHLSTRHSFSVSPSYSNSSTRIGSALLTRHSISHYPYTNNPSLSASTTNTIRKISDNNNNSHSNNNNSNTSNNHTTLALKTIEERLSNIEQILKTILDHSTYQQQPSSYHNPNRPINNDIFKMTYNNPDPHHQQQPDTINKNFNSVPSVSQTPRFDTNENSSQYTTTMQLPPLNTTTTAITPPQLQFISDKHSSTQIPFESSLMVPTSSTSSSSSSTSSATYKNNINSTTPLPHPPISYSPSSTNNPSSSSSLSSSSPSNKNVPKLITTTVMEQQQHTSSSSSTNYSNSTNNNDKLPTPPASSSGSNTPPMETVSPPTSSNLSNPQSIIPCRQSLGSIVTPNSTSEDTVHNQ
ncbi:hypothetical protein BJ944DRAFT_227509 [Cunninghamella echinulata]|nr:hypothetical protein BJ944DRAFT_227509 [Cunninghamella echinulata]